MKAKPMEFKATVKFNQFLKALLFIAKRWTRGPLSDYDVERIAKRSAEMVEAMLDAREAGPDESDPDYVVADSDWVAGATHEIDPNALITYTSKEGKA